jgi:hypothetical protein
LWVKHELLTGSRYYADTSIGTTGFGFRHNGTAIECFAYSGGLTGQVSAAANLAADGNKWVHLACDHNATSTRIYKNGVLLNTSLYDASSGVDDAAATMNIGGDYIGGSGLLGSIDEFKLYDRALSTAEIQADYNSWMHSNYDSPVKDAGEAVNWDAMDWNAFVDVNNNVTVDYRGCSTADCSTAGAWMGGFKSANTGNSQLNIYADNNRYFQFRLSFDTNNQQWNGVRSPAIADGDKGKFGHVSNVWVSYSSISAGGTCDCPVSGNWEINDASVCTLSTVCSLSAGSLHISNGALYVTATGTLSVPTGYKIIVAKTNGKLVVEKQGKVVINK